MNVREVRMTVAYRQMDMCMGMGFQSRVIGVMNVLVVLIMAMAVSVLQRRMLVVMCMHLSQVQPYTQAHERRREPKQPRDRFTQYHD